MLKTIPPQMVVFGYDGICRGRHELWRIVPIQCGDSTAQAGKLSAKLRGCKSQPQDCGFIAAHLFQYGEQRFQRPIQCAVGGGDQ